MPLFPRLELVSASPLIIRNIGECTLKTRTYAEPEYRLIVRLLANGRVVQDQWLALPKDLHPGESVQLDFTPRASADELRLYHAMQDVPMLDPEAWEMARV